MPTRLQISTARRRALTAQSQALRARLLASSEGVRGSLGIGQLGVSALRSLRRHPALAAGFAIALVVAGPRRLRRALSLGLGAWSLFDGVRSLVATLGAAKRPK